MVSCHAYTCVDTHERSEHDHISTYTYDHMCASYKYCHMAAQMYMLTTQASSEHGYVLVHMHMLMWRLEDSS